eukprot:8424818-Ditylum_brightwellii.AAC.1
MAKNLHIVLNELGSTQQGPTMICKDDAAAIMMANANKPSGCTCHIDISYFELQEWVQQGEVKLAHNHEVANPADALTKALGWVLHCHHVRQIVRCVGTVYTNSSIGI